ncbi:unnamed protein product [Ranitomeya imitator]|uniref:RWD domain-containing protein n=1 Tax=Ranitomeya imitator TaxID=111125 RepID=A0ABN9MN48_9NEOB|nr:unnamed protein product [Ranitomeya imitator]
MCTLVSRREHSASIIGRWRAVLCDQHNDPKTATLQRSAIVVYIEAASLNVDALRSSQSHLMLCFIDVQVTLKFTYVESYPDEAPLYEIVSQENLEDSDASAVLALLAEQAQENLGMVMIFTLVSAAQDKLNEIIDQIKNRREEEKIQKEKEVEEAEKKRFHGTPVTIENFLNWKAKFDVEMVEMRRKRQKEEEQAGKSKLSGKSPVTEDPAFSHTLVLVMDGHPFYIRRALDPSENIGPLCGENVQRNVFSARRKIAQRRVLRCLSLAIMEAYGRRIHR